MKTIRCLLFLLLTSAFATPSAVHTIQVTIGSSVTELITTDTYAHVITVQNNASHVMRVGDSTTTSSKGAELGVGPPGGSMTVAVHAPLSLNLANFYVAGTQNDVLDVIYVD